MKIKIILLGGVVLWHGILLPMHSIGTPVGVDQDHAAEDSHLESTIRPVMKSKTIKEAKTEKEEDDVLFLKLQGDMAMKPSIAIYEGKALEPANKVEANLALKADIPSVLGNKNAKVSMNLELSTKEVKFTEAVVTLGKYTLGYGTTFFAYEKANAALPVTIDGTVLQLKFEDTFDHFRWGLAIEKAIELKVGQFDKKQAQEEAATAEQDKQKAAAEKDKQEVNQLDDPKQKTTFKLKNDIPALSVMVAMVTDRMQIAVTALGRLTNYTHSIDAKPKKVPHSFTGSYGVNVGMQYKQDKCTVTGQGVYVFGLGDYISALAEMQEKEERKEMCACYYLNDKENQLNTMRAWGIGGTLEVAATSKWTISVAGAYLAMLDGEDKPATAFKNQWKVILPKLTYTFNKHWKINGGYSLTREGKIDPQKNESIKHAFNSDIKFSF